MSEYLDLTVAPFTAVGSPAIASDLHGRANTYDFDKVNDMLTCSESPVAAAATKFTVSFWINTKAATGSILNNRPTSGAGNYFYLNVTATGLLSFAAQNATSYLLSNASTAIPISTWTHVVGVMDLSTDNVDLYINGAEVSYASQNAVSGPDIASFTGSTLGVSSDYNDSFSSGMLGSVGRLKFQSGTAWNATQALDEYNAEVAAMVGLTDCEDHLYTCGDTSSPAVDSVGGSGFNLTAASSPTFNGAGTGTITLHKSSVDRLTTTSKLFDANGDFSGYFKGKLPQTIAALNRLLSHTVNTVGPTVDLYVSTNLFIDVYAQVSAGYARAVLDLGVVPSAIDPTVDVGLAFSYSQATKTMVARVRTSSGIDVTDSDIGTVNPAYSAGTYKVGCSAADGSGTDIELDQFGVKNGIAYTDAQLLTALESLVSQNTAPTLDTIPDQSTYTGIQSTYTIPGSLITDAETADEDMIVTATQGDDSPLPADIVFDGATRTFTTNVAQGSPRTQSIKVTIEDEGGLTDTYTFTWTFSLRPTGILPGILQPVQGSSPAPILQPIF